MSALARGKDARLNQANVRFLPVAAVSDHRSERLLWAQTDRVLRRFLTGEMCRKLLFKYHRAQSPNPSEWILRCNRFFLL
jgi:hypothetical protein